MQIHFSSTRKGVVVCSRNSPQAWRDPVVYTANGIYPAREALTKRQANQFRQAMLKEFGPDVFNDKPEWNEPQ